MPPRCLVVYYEHLQRDLPAELERIAAFLQCPPELTRAPRGLRTVRMGYAYQFLEYCTRGTGQLAPRAPRARMPYAYHSIGCAVRTA